MRRDESGTAIVALSDAGWEQVAAQGRDGFVAAVEAAFRESDRSIPTGWRFVRRMTAERAGDRPLLPDWHVMERTATALGAEARITSDLAVLDGHFPNEPIVPGVAQLYWADALARRAFPDHAAPHEVVRLKFVRVIVPGTMLRLNLVRRARSRVEFRYTSDEGVHSSGCLVGESKETE